MIGGNVMNENALKTYNELDVKSIKVNISTYARDNHISWSTAKKILEGNTKRKKEL
jgi:hypothetical protein